MQNLCFFTICECSANETLTDSVDQQYYMYMQYSFVIEGSGFPVTVLDVEEMSIYKYAGPEDLSSRLVGFSQVEVMGSC